MILEEIEEVVQRISALDGVVGVVLFGSYSRGEQDEGSDIDLLVIFENKEALRKNQGKAYQITAETPFFFQVVALTLEEFRKSPLFKPALWEGRTLYAKPWLRELFELHKPYALITYSTPKLSSRERVVFVQRLEGRREGKYRYPGLLDEVEGVKVGRGVILVPFKHLGKVTKFLEEAGAEYVVRRIWM